ncbi:ribbon-helix-helix domain-containing protein [Methylobacterium durans]|uniref:ribbon-helix-helix domain-containing protein n=1 Tax=Methylobacterium durans TaxID=2202825 RepID=UPI002B0020DA|nr:ribbon-helix-helix domain-containing protein [Methylobacterium durans]MEA1834579.1 ribbon-helix-helix domain-containing protein [Methylobacterium durans]
MSKPPKLNLASIVAAAAPLPKLAPVKPAPVPALAPVPQSAEIVQLDVAPAPARRPSATLKERARQMSVYLEPPVYDQLRDLAYAERTKMHALMLEALDLLFKQRGARSIEQLNENPPR